MIRPLLILVSVSVVVLGVGAGNRAFEQGRFEDAVAEYARALERGGDSALLRYNLGTALLRLGRYAEAREHLERAGGDGVEHRVRQPARYNAGNSELEPAFGAEASPERSEALRRAILHYRQALLLDPTDADAKWNLELAQRLLAQQAGGGGGADDPQQGGGGGGGDQDDTARPDPAPGEGGGDGAQPQMSPAEAERVLRSAAEVERELQQQKLRRGESPPPMVRDW
jgi:Ca-activated chloride channel homolog